MKPKEPKKYIADNHLLQTRDIPGAYAGYVPPTLERREYRNTNYIQDIDGAHADSIRHSIRTNRSTNPLAPVYQALDPSEVLAPLIPALLPKDLIKMPTLRQKPSKSDNSKNITNALQNLGEYVLTITFCSQILI